MREFLKVSCDLPRCLFTLSSTMLLNSILDRNNRSSELFHECPVARWVTTGQQGLTGTPAHECDQACFALRLSFIRLHDCVCLEQTLMARQELTEGPGRQSNLELHCVA